MIAFLLPVLGASGLCLAMPKHYRQVFANQVIAPGTRTVLRILGWLLLLAAASVSVAVNGAGIGLTLFAAYTTVAIFSIALILSGR